MKIQTTESDFLHKNRNMREKKCLCVICIFETIVQQKKLRYVCCCVTCIYFNYIEFWEVHRVGINSIEIRQLTKLTVFRFIIQFVN